MTNASSSTTPEWLLKLRQQANRHNKKRQRPTTTTSNNKQITSTFNSWFQNVLKQGKSSIQYLQTLMQRYNPIMNTLELLIYTSRSTGMFSLAQSLIELRRIIYVLYRFMWSFLFLFDESRQGDQWYLQNQQSMDNSSNYLSSYQPSYDSYYPSSGNTTLGDQPYYHDTNIGSSTSMDGGGYYDDW
jgi:hypothetical protein